MPTRQLRDLTGIGPAMLKDFELLRIGSVEQLAQQDPAAVYRSLCRLTATRQDPCVLDTFVWAVAQACDPDLPAGQRNWWYWSRVRKAAQRK